MLFLIKANLAEELHEWQNEWNAGLYLARFFTCA
jgi:hypothetical protein